MRNPQRWLKTLVRQKQICRVGGGRTSRYKLADRHTALAPTALSAVGQALHVLVSQPLAERPPAKYRRPALDAYRPNQTFLLPQELRQRLGAMAARSTLPAPPVPAQNGSAAAQPGGAAGAAPGGILGATIADLAWRLGWLEATLTPNPDVRREVLSLADVTRILAQ